MPAPARSRAEGAPSAPVIVQPADTGGSRLRPTLGGVLAVVTLAVAVLGPLSFTLLRLVYTQFYEPFGLQPEDVGLDSTRILATSLTGFGLVYGEWLLVWFVLFAQAAVLIAFVAAADESQAKESRSETLAVAGVSLGFGLLFGISAASLVDASKVATSEFTRLAWALVAAAPLALALRYAPVTQLQWPRSLLARRSARILLAAIAVIATIYCATAQVGEDVTTVGTRNSAQVRQGAPVSDVRLDRPKGWAGVRALDIEADAVGLDWLDKVPTTLADKTCFMYLGDSNGMALLWDVKPRRLIRVPLSTIAIVPAAHGRCPA